MDLRILGPLRVERDGSPIALGIPRQRCLLALLLLRRGEVVDVDRLEESVGGVQALPIVFGHHPDLRDVARRSISDETYRRAWTRGRTMSAYDAVTVAFDGRPPTTAEVRDAVALWSP